MNRRHFWQLRQQYCDAVATSNSVRVQYIGQTIGYFAQPALGDLFVLPIRPSVQNSQAIRLLFRPAIANIDPDIVSSWY